MRVSWNWLGDFVDLDGLTPEVVADRLTMSGMEVEGIERRGAALDGVVLGTIVTWEAHPDADALSICTVSVGASEPLTIVCGAPNARQGLRAPVALVGTSLPGGLTIKKAKIRGQASAGMLCSAAELELDADASGLLELNALDAADGTPIASALGIDDAVLDISLTPNRADGLSIRGVAREVSALFGREFRDAPLLPGPAATLSPGNESIDEILSVRLEDTDACPRYACAAVRGVRVAPSPPWLRERLEAVGQRPVNNLVDVTNYILFEQGQPLHAFDLGAIRGGEIVVRRARDGETLVAIDHVERTLGTDDLVIADARGPVALAGVMGGADSEISDTTTDILIECATFDPSTVRRTARGFGMHTESSHRFERGVDVERVPAVLARTLELIAATQVEVGAVCIPLAGNIDAYPVPRERRRIALPVDLCERILGVPTSAEDACAILSSLGLDVQRGEAELVVTVPGFRPDLERPVDLVEEVGRVRGYDVMEPTPLPGELGLVHGRRADTPPRAQESQPVRTTFEVEALDHVRDALVARGMFEAVTWPMTDPGRVAAFASDDRAIRLKNPLGEERSVMRRSLLAGLLDSLGHNLARGEESVALFELGRVYPPGEAGAPIPDENPEPLMLGVVWCGSVDEHWSGTGRPVDGHDLVGAATSALAAAGVALRAVESPSGPPSWSHPAVSAALVAGRREAGWVGRLHPDILDRWGIDVPVFALELELSGLISPEAPVPSYRTIGRTPSSWRDAALLVDVSTPWAALQNALDGFSNALLESVRLFDVYEGGALPDGKKSLAIRAVYRDPSGTLTDEVVDKVHGKLLRHLEHRAGAVLRTA